MELNYFQVIMNYAWQLMSIPITLYGFTFSYAQVFCLVLLATLCLRAICFYLFTVR